MKAHTSFKSLKNIDRVDSWLYRIISNLIIDYYRSIKPVVSFPDEYQIPEEQRNPSSELSRCIEQHIFSLPDIYQSALILSELGGHTHQEVADNLDISLSAAKSRVRRGKEKLKECYLACCKIEIRASNIVDYEQHEADEKK